jgi:hypothetical protein
VLASRRPAAAAGDDVEDFGFVAQMDRNGLVGVIEPGRPRAA